MVKHLMGGDWAMANLALVPQTMVLVSWAIANWKKVLETVAH